MLIGILASFFFASTFVINRAMDLSGGSWIWSASLRYVFMVPFLLVIVLMRRNWKPLYDEMRSHLKQWIGWSFIGFVLFYAPICYAAAYSPAWLVAGTWQVTIIAGSLLVPLFGRKIPFKGLSMSLIILVGVALMQADYANEVGAGELLSGIIPVVIAAFAYPLGNRKMMVVTGGRLDAYQRVLGMTIASMPFWFILSLFGFFTVGLPSIEQANQTIIVALSSGVIATGLFFTATDLARDSVHQLAAVEATQAGAVIFTVLGEWVILSGQLPTGWAFIGIILVVGGMVLHSYLSNGRKVALRPILADSHKRT
ncbi:MAG: multidrug resistance efflux transporter family protein [Bacilli bacterium]